MRFGPRSITLAALLILFGFCVSAQFAAGKKKDKSGFPVQMEEGKRALHALNRLTFGPRPGDLEHVQAVGVDKWIDEQLHPERIDDGALEARLAAFPTLRMDARQLVEDFPPPAVIKAVANGKTNLPTDPARRAIYQAQIERRQEKQDQKNSAVGSDESKSNETPQPAASRRSADRSTSDPATQQLLEMPPDQRMSQILSMTPPQQRALSASLTQEQRTELVEGMSPQQRETLMAIHNPTQVVVNELVQSKLLRAIYSERQLDEVMTDFWINHFNVFIGKSADRYLLTGYERDVIRPHALGKFEDLLVATAQSPAMLFYLDNWLSVGPNSDVANGLQKKRKHNSQETTKQAKGKRGGLNENYGRELMELHTLGVNGGYSQSDVTEVARVFTGWTVRRPREGDDFRFDPRMHEPGDKTVLGHRIKSGGQKEGLEVLHLLAHHPATAKFISMKLAMRFVSDTPPPALVAEMSHTFLKKDGDIREVLKTMLHSPEFWSADEYRAKVKTPLEFVVSAVRASGAEVSNAMPLARQLETLGMPLYGMQPPTGYSMQASTWINSAALLGRMNFALALTSGKLKGVATSPERISRTGNSSADPLQTLAALEDSLLAGDVSRQTHETIAAQLNDSKISRRRLDDPARPPNMGVVAGLILGSPEFQRR